MVGDTRVVINADDPCCVATSRGVAVDPRDTTNADVSFCVDADVSTFVVRKSTRDLVVPSTLVMDVFLSFCVVANVAISSDTVSGLLVSSTIYTPIYHIHTLHL